MMYVAVEKGTFVMRSQVFNRLPPQCSVSEASNRRNRRRKRRRRRIRRRRRRMSRRRKRRRRKMSE